MCAAAKQAFSLEVVTARVLATLGDVERIVLFGSRAKGLHSVDSDVDLLIIVQTDLPINERTVGLRLALRGLGVGFDLIVLTPDEIEQHRAWKSGVVAKALDEGVVLHAAA
jgi:uncharacterized protein